MPHYQIVVEEATITLKAKTFEADSLEDARARAEEEDWHDPSWEEYDTSGHYEIRDDQCYELSEAKP